LLDCKSCFPDKASQCTFRKFPVIGDCESSKWNMIFSKNYMAAGLMIRLVTNLGEGFYRVFSRNNR